MDLDYIRAPDIGPDKTAFVSPTFHYDTFKHTFPTIQEAIDYLYTTYGAVPGVTVFVYPGTYTEQIHSYPGFYIHGIARDVPTNEPRPVTLYNTGLDADHYPLRGDDGDGYNIQNMNIRTDTDGVFGKLADNRFSECRFEGGYFIDGTQDIHVYSTWCDCSFLSCKAFDITGNSPSSRYLVFEHCWFGWWKTAIFNSTSPDKNLVLDMDGGHLAFTKLELGGNWYHFMKNIHSFGAYRHEYDTTKGIVYRNVTISNGIHFKSNPTIPPKFVALNTEDGAEMPIPVGEADITADVTITDVIFQNNSMHNGLDGEIHITNTTKNVGGTAQNRYRNITEAIKSVTAKGIIVLYESQIDIPKIVMPTTRIVEIDGQGMYGLTFTGDIVDLGLDDILLFQDCGNIIGGTAKIDGNNAELHVHACFCNNVFEILMTSGVGAHVHIRDSCITGPTGKSALQINSTDPDEYRITYTRLIGATGQPAVEFTVDADNVFKTKVSTFIHGDGGANSPLIYTGVGKVDIAVYNCGLNATWNAASFNNTIIQAGNVTDTAIDF